MIAAVTAAADRLRQLQQSQNKSEAGGNARLAQRKETPAVRSLNHEGKTHPREPKLRFSQSDASGFVIGHTRVIFE